MARLLKKYRNEMQGKIKEKLGLSNLMEVPRIDKVTLNMGVGEAVTDKKVLEKEFHFSLLLDPCFTA